MDADEIRRAAQTIDFRWAAAAILVMMLQIPMVGLRWSKIVDALGDPGSPISRGPVIAVTAIFYFFAQVAPSIAADSARVVMLTHLGPRWGRALVSVVVDRAVGILALAAVGFASLWLPSTVAGIQAYRAVALEVLGAVVALGLASVVLAPFVARVLDSWQYTRWAGELVMSVHSILFRSAGGAAIFGIALSIHAVAVVAIWILGFALDLRLPLADAAVLFTILLGAALVPVSIGGWGVRELAVTAVLRGSDMPFEKSLLFSISFGLIVLAAALPGAAVWAVYSPKRQADTVPASRP